MTVLLEVYYNIVDWILRIIRLIYDVCVRVTCVYIDVCVTFMKERRLEVRGGRCLGELLVSYLDLVSPV